MGASALAGSAGAGSVVASMPSFLIRLRRWLSRCAQAVSPAHLRPCGARRRVFPEPIPGPLHLLKGGASRQCVSRAHGGEQALVRSQSTRWGSHRRCEGGSGDAKSGCACQIDCRHFTIPSNALTRKRTDMKRTPKSTSEQSRVRESASNPYTTWASGRESPPTSAKKAESQ